MKAKLRVCDSTKVYFESCKKENFHLRNGLEVQTEENNFLREINKDIYYQNDQLKKAVERQKKKNKGLGIGLGTGLGVLIVVTTLSFLIK